MSRGHGRCGTFQLGWQREQTTAGSGAGACRLQSGAFSDAALPPQGQGALPVCGIDAVCPVGAKALQSGAPDFGLSRERAGSWGALPIRNGWQARRGTGKGARRFTIFRTRKSQRSVPSAGPVSPAIPQGDRRALPAPAQGIHPLRIPFWGTAPVFPRSPSPKTPQATGPCSWACRRLLLPSSHPERNAAHPPPAHGVGVRLPRAEGTGRRHCRPRVWGWRCRPC